MSQSVAGQLGGELVKLKFGVARQIHFQEFRNSVVVIDSLLSTLKLLEVSGKVQTLAFMSLLRYLAGCQSCK